MTRFALSWTLTATLGTALIFASLARLDAQLAKQAVDRQEQVSAYRSAHMEQGQ